MPCSEGELTGPEQEEQAVEPTSRLDLEGRRAHVVIVIGTRPEAIKLAPVCRAFAERGAAVTVVLTGQHREMVGELLGPLGIAEYVDADLDVMTPRQKLTTLAAASMEGLGAYFATCKPDAVVVQGDTTTALCGALAAFYEQIPVAHVEAGLRSGSLLDPFPEEMNRQLISRVSQWQFAPTKLAAHNLEMESIPPERIQLVGNTVVDSLHWVIRRRLGNSAFLPGTGRRRLLVTLHRRETRGERLRGVVEAIGRSAEKTDTEVVFPVHPSPDVRDVVLPASATCSHVRVCEPLGYFDLVATLAAADLVLTDSGGIQEEAPTLGTPVLVARNTTERPEAVEAGCALLVGTEPSDLEKVLVDLIEDEERRQSMTASTNPFGDGHAARRLATCVLHDIAAARGSEQGGAGSAWI